MVNLSNRQHFLPVYTRNKPTLGFRRTQENLAHHEQAESDLQAISI